MKRLVLAGAGHAHAGVLREFARMGLPGVELLLLSPSLEVPSSGMLPGYLAGHYSWEECCIDFKTLCRKAGARLVTGTLAGVDPLRHHITLECGATLGYDWLSLNLGPTMAPPSATMPLLPLRPLHQLRQHWQAICDSVAAMAPDSHYRLCVVGGGAAGVESVLSMLHRLRQIAPQVNLSATIALAGASLMRGSAAGAARLLQHQLRHAGVNIVTGFTATGFDRQQLCAADGRRVGADCVVWATAAQAQPCLLGSGLSLDQEGFVCIDRYLRSVSHPDVFAAGDCASFVAPLPKAGVYAVRMGPVLARNLRAAATQAEMQPYRPQPRFLTLIGTGGAHAVASWGPLAWQGRWLWRWKQRIDRQFLNRHG